jgi:hypothetical protein
LNSFKHQSEASHAPDTRDNTASQRNAALLSERFPNGNSRHAREMADLLIERLGGDAFTWGSGSLQDTGALRTKYVNALKAADEHDMTLLMDFVRS